MGEDGLNCFDFAPHEPVFLRLRVSLIVILGRPFRDLCEMIEGRGEQGRREGMQKEHEKQTSFEDWALAQRIGPNEVLEKIDALVDFPRPKDGWRQPTVNWGDRDIGRRYCCASCSYSTAMA